MTTRKQENIVTSFFYYMWNAWNETECSTVFGSLAGHFWEKWDYLYRKYYGGAAEHFYAELSPANRRLIVERACELYDGNASRKNPKYTGKQWEDSPQRPVLVIRHAPKSFANFLTACSIPFAYSMGTFIILDSTPIQTAKEYLERHGVQPAEIEKMEFSQREIGINDITSI